jgi:hypothetical protein
MFLIYGDNEEQVVSGYTPMLASKPIEMIVNYNPELCFASMEEQ